MWWSSDTGMKELLVLKPLEKLKLLKQTIEKASMLIPATKARIESLIERTDAFTDGGQFALCGASSIVSIETIANPEDGEPRVYLIEVYAVGQDVFSTLDIPMHDQWVFIEGWTTHDVSEAMLKYASVIVERSVERISNL